LVHGAASIERHPRTFNGIALVALALGVEARAASLPPWLEVGGSLYGLAVVDTGGGPRQRPEAVGTLDVQAAPTRALRAQLELRSRAGGPFEGGPGPAVYNLNQAFQNYSPALEARQAFLEWRGRRAEVRAGIQTFAWGKLDGVPPTDVVNPRDWHDPLVVDEFFEEQKIGIPALLGTYFLPDLPRASLSELRLGVAWIPWAVPARLPLALERWFPPTISDLPLNACVPVPGFAPNRGCGADQVRVRADFGTLNAGPPHSLNAGGIAARLAATWHGADLELSHYTGPETGPNAKLQIVAFNKGTPQDLDVRAAVRLAQEHSVMHMTGAAAALPAGPFTLRGEVVWLVDHAYLRPADDVIAPVLAGEFPGKNEKVRRILAGKAVGIDVPPLFPLLDAVEWGIGADTLWHGVQPLLQLNQTIILGDAPRLLISNPETRLSGTLRRRLANDRVELEVRGLWEIERGALYVFPRASYQVFENLWVRAGYLVLAGVHDSVLGQFRDNDEVVFQARMTF
jgi:hypothetical protein